MNEANDTNDKVLDKTRRLSLMMWQQYVPVKIRFIRALSVGNGSIENFYQRQADSHDVQANMRACIGS